MKISKINKEFLDLYYKKKLIAYEVYEDKVYLTDSYRLFVMNVDDCILDLSKFKNVPLVKLCNDFGYQDGIITNTLYKDKYNMRLITGKDNLLNIKVNDKYLELFDDPDIKVIADNKPVLIYEKGELVGLIVPIKEY